MAGILQRVPKILVSNEISKTAKLVIAGPILKLFNKILDSSIYPSQWKYDILTPIHKSGGKDRHGNNSSPTGNLEYRGNSYCKVRDTVFSLDYIVIVKELYGLSEVVVFQSVSAAC